MSAPRVALVGPRRVRQGLGPFVARYLREHGAEVVAVLGSSTESAQAGAREIELPGGAPLPAFVDLTELVERSTPDAVAILSPHSTHEAYLEAALEHSLHVFCEKPLIFGGPELHARARGLVDRFRAAGLLLVENCQWPEVLPSYWELFPEQGNAPIRRFAMQLSPATSAPRSMLADALSHPLSLLQALAPASLPELRALRFAFEGPAGEEAARSSRGPEGDAAASPETDAAAFLEAGAAACVRVAFRFVAGAADIECALELRESRSLPRPAGFGVNGHWANRQVREPGYQIYLTSAAGSVKVPDPLGTRVGSFVRQLDAVLSGRSPADPAPVAERMRLLAEVDEALETMRAS